MKEKSFILPPWHHLPQQSISGDEGWGPREPDNSTRCLKQTTNEHCLCLSSVATGGKCHSYQWKIGGWSNNERAVWCQRSDGVNVTGWTWYRLAILKEPYNSTHINPYIVAYSFWFSFTTLPYTLMNRLNLSCLYCCSALQDLPI